MEVFPLLALPPILIRKSALQHSFCHSVVRHRIETLFRRQVMERISPPTDSTPSHHSGSARDASASVHICTSIAKAFLVCPLAVLGSIQSAYTNGFPPFQIRQKTRRSKLFSHELGQEKNGQTVDNDGCRKHPCYLSPILYLPFRDGYLPDQIRIRVCTLFANSLQFFSVWESGPNQTPSNLTGPFFHCLTTLAAFVLSL